MKKIKYTACFAALLCFFSCVEETSPETIDTEEGYIEATVSFDLKLSPDEPGTAMTKVVDDPHDDYMSTAVRNISVLQYDGTGDDARIVGQVHYLSADADPDSEEYLDLSRIKLADSNGKENTIVILANTFTPMTRIGTLGQLLNLTRCCYNSHDLFGHTGQGGDLESDDTVYYMRMFALAVTPVAEGITVKATLRRTIAHLKIRIENKGNDGVRIRNVRLRNVPINDYYITDYHYTGADGNEYSFRETPFHDKVNLASPFNRDYQEVIVEESDGAQNLSLDYYVTCNQRGSIVNDSPRLKNALRPNDAATYLEVNAYYGSGHDRPVRYKFYLGGNMTDDFNINPNTLYEYKFTIDGKGNSELDKRVEDWGGKDYGLDANCYFIKPPVEGNAYYSFNVVHRPNLFWGDRFGLYNKDEYRNNCISIDEQWHAFIIWTDMILTTEQVKDFLVVREGTGAGGYFDDNQRVVVKVPADMPKGNILLGIYTDDPANVLWSWHLWVTDYEPDSIVGVSPVEGKFVYNVPGGEVNRYNNIYWTAEYGRENAYAMDRDLGAVDRSGTRAKFYSYGRKDPFCLKWGSYPYNPITFERTSNSVADMTFDDLNKKYGTGGSNIPYSVNHPRCFIKGTSGAAWTTYSALAGGTVCWADPKTSVRDEYEEQFKKSMFDPCPPGWTVIFKNAFVDFKGTDNGVTTTDPAVNFQWNSDPYKRHSVISGRSYFPLGYLNDKDSPSPQAAFFPKYGLENDWTAEGLWMAADGNTDWPPKFVYKVDSRWNPPVQTTTGRAYGRNSIRCVRLN